MDSKLDILLEMDQVTIKPVWPYNTTLDHVNLRLAPGELALVVLESGHICPLLADLAQGLLEPNSGMVRFLGQPWTSLSIEHLARQRSLIGRVFSTSAWVSNLDLDENILLAQQHHRTRSIADLNQEATDLAQCLGLEHLPHTRPDVTSLREKQLAQWVRALLGEKRLLILEQPCDNLSSKFIPKLVEALNKARNNGTAALWISAKPEEYQHPNLIADSRYRLQDSRLIRDRRRASIEVSHG